MLNFLQKIKFLEKFILTQYINNARELFQRNNKLAEFLTRKQKKSQSKSIDGSKIPFEFGEASIKDDDLKKYDGLLLLRGTHEEKLEYIPKNSSENDFIRKIDLVNDFLNSNEWERRVTQIGTDFLKKCEEIKNNNDGKQSANDELKGAVEEEYRNMIVKSMVSQKSPKYKIPGTNTKPLNDNKLDMIEKENEEMVLGPLKNQEVNSDESKNQEYKGKKGKKNSRIINRSISLRHNKSSRKTSSPYLIHVLRNKTTPRKSKMKESREIVSENQMPETSKTELELQTHDDFSSDENTEDYGELVSESARKQIKVDKKIDLEGNLEIFEKAQHLASDLKMEKLERSENDPTQGPTENKKAHIEAKNGKESRRTNEMADESETLCENVKILRTFKFTPSDDLLYNYKNENLLKTEASLNEDESTENSHSTFGKFSRLNDTDLEINFTETGLEEPAATHSNYPDVSDKEIAKPKVAKSQIYHPHSRYYNPTMAALRKELLPVAELKSLLKSSSGTVAKQKPFEEGDSDTEFSLCESQLTDFNENKQLKSYRFFNKRNPQLKKYRSDS